MQLHKHSTDMDNCAGRGHQEPRCPLVHSQWWRTSERHERKEKVRRCVLNVLVTIPACSHERPERHAHCRVWDDVVPVLHVEPIRARLRQLRVVVQELEQDSNEVVTPRPEPQHVDTSKTKAQSWAKGTTERASLLFFFFFKKKKNDICNFKKCPAKDFFHCRLKLIRKN